MVVVVVEVVVVDGHDSRRYGNEGMDVHKMLWQMAVSGGPCGTQRGIWWSSMFSGESFPS